MARQINLYDPALLKRRDWLSLGNVVAAGLLMAVVVGAAGYLARSDLPVLMARETANNVQLQALREQVVVLGKQVTGRKPDPVAEQEIHTLRLLLATRGEVIDLLKKNLGPGALSYAEFLRGLARQSVSGLWLTGFAMESAGSMEISGRTFTPALVPEYILRLNREPVFQGHAFSALTLAAHKPDAPTPPGQSAATGQPEPYEFKLVPRKALGESDGAAMLTQGQTGGGRG